MRNARGNGTSDLYPADSNRLISALSRQDQEFFHSKSTRVEMKLGEVLAEPGDTIKYCYFPVSGVISMITLMSSGAGAEVGLVGTEGMFGYSVLLNDPRTPHQALVQGKCEAHRIPTVDLLTLCDDSKSAAALFHRYISGMMSVVSQGAACNALHKAEARMARWILLVQDRLHGDMLPITHEFLANMLGIRRATVTVVANVLEEQGLVALGRREIRVIDRDGLLKASCECYTAMTEATSRSV
jgi:CRP-like cAMP-binding protein